MAVSTYTTYDAVRLALGVDDDELSNDTIEVETVGYELEELLLGISSTLIDDFATVADIDEEDRDADEQSLYRRVRLFGAAAVAYRLCSGLPLLAPKDITDGKAAVSRFTGTPYADVIARVTADYTLAYGRLIQVVTGQDDLSTTFPQMMAFSSLSRDPVVSE